MTARLVKSVDDEEEVNLPVVNSLGVLRTTTTESTYRDPFSVDAAEVKKFTGTDAVFKRRVTNDLKKYRRGDGAESKQVEDNDITGYDAFGVVTPP